MEPTRTRPLAMIGLTLTFLAALYALGIALTSTEPPLGFAVQALIHVGELAVLIALALSGAVGPGILGRVGLGIAVLGELLLVVAELVFPGSPDVGTQLFNVAPPLSGIGMLIVGVAVLRTGRWSGWHRFAPLVVGLWMFVVLTPALIVSGGPPAVAAVLGIAGWDLCWALLALAALRETATDRSRAVA